MRFTFLHAADLHLGSPLRGLFLKDEGVARRLAAASRDAFADLVSRAIAEKVAFVLIAGDVYDGEWRDTAIGLFFNREVSRLHRAGIPVFIIRGNHDAESEVTKAVTLPDSVTVFSTRKAETHRLAELRVALHGRSFQERAVTENYASLYPRPVEGWFNVGLLHTSCEGHAAHETYAPCTVAQLAAHGYDYWALGHVHEHRVLSTSPHIVFPGNLQGRSVRECGPKGAVLVDVADGRVERLRAVHVDRARWLHETVDVSGARDEREVLSLVREALRDPLVSAADRLVALRVTLSGATPAHNRLKSDPQLLRTEIQALADQRREDVWLEAVKVATTPPPASVPDGGDDGLDMAALLAGLENDPALRDEASQLLAQVLARIPPSADGREALEAELDAIVADARALALGRAGVDA
jgi:DNA repair exonuclease SbcCD nuclease subunit